MKYIFLILLLIPIVSAETTFFDQDDSFIMVPKPLSPEETTGRKKLNITLPPIIQKQNITNITKENITIKPIIEHPKIKIKSTPYQIYDILFNILWLVFGFIITTLYLEKK